MPVWLSMILCGARAGGLRETRTINFESLRIPDLFPDSRAGSAHYATLRRDEEDRYFRYSNFLLFVLKTFVKQSEYNWFLLQETSKQTHKFPETRISDTFPPSLGFTDQRMVYV